MHYFWTKHVLLGSCSTGSGWSSAFGLSLFSMCHSTFWRKKHIKPEKCRLALLVLCAGKVQISCCQRVIGTRTARCTAVAYPSAARPADETVSGARPRGSGNGSAHGSAAGQRAASALLPPVTARIVATARTDQSSIHRTTPHHHVPSAHSLAPLIFPQAADSSLAPRRGEEGRAIAEKTSIYNKLHAREPFGNAKPCSPRHGPHGPHRPLALRAASAFVRPRKSRKASVSRRSGLPRPGAAARGCKPPRRGGTVPGRAALLAMRKFQ